MSQEAYAGKDLGAQIFAASPELIRQYIRGIGDQHPWYPGESPSGGPVAPALSFSRVSSLFSGWRHP